MENLRYAARLAHAFVSFGPGRESRIGLGPMGYGSLITPMQKTWHGFLVRPSRHELAHALLRVPASHRPKGPAPVSQERSFLKPGRLLYLADDAERVKPEEW